MATSEPIYSTKSKVQQEFYKYFQAEEKALQQRIDGLADLTLVGSERNDDTDCCLAGVTKLSKEVNEAVAYLSAHDQRTYADSVKALKARLDQVRAAKQPKPKFSFKSRQKNASAASSGNGPSLARTSGLQASEGIGDHTSGLSSPSQSSNVASQEARLCTAGGSHEVEDAKSTEDEQYPALEDMPETMSIRRPSFSYANSINISGHSGLHIVLPLSASGAISTGKLFRIRRSVIDMSTPTNDERQFTSLTLRNVRDSLIVCGKASGPVYLTGLKRAVVVVSCRQFRMHDSKDCEVYLFCLTGPIIEQCKGIKFAPLPSCQMSEADQQIENKWNQVNDFHWLRAEPSPHWSMIPETERIKKHTWNQVMAGTLNHGLDDILKAVGI